MNPQEPTTTKLQEQIRNVQLDVGNLNFKSSRRKNLAGVANNLLNEAAKVLWTLDRIEDTDEFEKEKSNGENKAS